ncbi:MAG: hypothetical protein LJE69_06670 [Thiohalocapsa sp.]|nr:hypothetical protein [Thiohalocapsa sp.]
MSTHAKGLLFSTRELSNMQATRTDPMSLNVHDCSPREKAVFHDTLSGLYRFWRLTDGRWFVVCWGGTVTWAGIGRDCGTAADVIVDAWHNDAKRELNKHYDA